MITKNKQIMNFIEKIEKYLVNNQLNLVIDDFLKLLSDIPFNSYAKSEANELRTQIIILAGRFNNLNEKVKLGIINSDSSTIERTSIINSFANILNQLPLTYDKLNSYIQNIDNENIGQQINVNTIKSNIRIKEIPYFDITNLIGRTEFLEKIHDYFSQSNNLILIIEGIQGIGKTTISLAYANHPTYSSEYNNIFWITQKSEFKNDLCSYFSNLKIGFAHNQQLNIDTNFDNIIEFLKLFSGKNLLIIDNANDIDELKSINTKLRQIGWKILITSQKAPMYYDPIIINELNSKHAQQLFEKYFHKPTNQLTIGKILNEIGNHTLLIELIAKVGNENPYVENDDELYKLLLTQGLNSDDFDFNIEINEKEKKMYEHIITLFDLSTLDDFEKEILLFFSLLPSTEINIKEITKIFDIPDNKRIEFAKTINDLVKKGLLISNKTVFKCHQVVQNIIREKFVPTTINCSKLIDYLFNYFQIKDYDKVDLFVIPPDITKETTTILIALSENLLKFIKDKDFRLSNLAHYLQDFFRVTSNYEKSKLYNEIAFNIIENIQPINTIMLARSYDHYGYINKVLDNFQLSLEYLLKAIDLLKQNTKENALFLANCYTNISLTYKQLNQLDLALQYITYSENIRKEKLEPNDPLLAVTFVSKSVILRELGNIDLSIDYALNAIKICISKELTDSHQLWGNIYYQTAKAYLYKQDYISALEYATKSKNFREKYLSKSHIDIADIYLLIAEISLKQENNNDFKSYVEKARNIYISNGSKYLDKISEFEDKLKKL